MPENPMIPSAQDLLFGHRVNETDETFLAQALRFARSGKYDAARAILSTLPDCRQTSGPILDLRAKIAAQQGNYTEAQELWTMALSGAPGNPSYLAGLERLERLRSSRRRAWRILAAASLSLLVLALILCGYISTTRILDEQRVTTNGLRQIETELQAIRSDALGADESMRSLLADLQNDNRDTGQEVERLANSLQDLSAELTVVGQTLKRFENRIELIRKTLHTHTKRLSTIERKTETGFEYWKTTLENHLATEHIHDASVLADE